MNALMFLYTSSFKNRFLGAIRSPKRLAKAIILILAVALFILGAVTGVMVGPEPAELLLLKGVMFLMFLFPYWAGRFGGIGSFETADVISTYVYRMGILQANWGFATAVGLFNSVINFILIVGANAISRRVSETSLW